MPDPVLRRLADWAAASEWSGLSGAVQERARWLLADTVACALAARDHPALEAARRVADEMDGEGTVWSLGGGRRRALTGAILETGAAIRALDFNDFYWGPGMGAHPSDLFATALALGQVEGSTLAEMLVAVALGYDLHLRLADAMHSSAPFDHTTATGLAAALLAGRLMRLDADTLAQGLAIAAIRAPALSAIRRGHIASAKAVAPALAQIDAVRAMHLARAGMTGPVAACDGAVGLAALLRPGAGIESLVPTAPGTDRICAVTIKRYPCIGTGQAVAEACARLSRRIDPARIARIGIAVAASPISDRQVAPSYRHPDSRETADHSLYVIAAMALLDGDLVPEQFARGRWRDPDVRALAGRMELRADLPGARDGLFGADVRIAMDDGSEETEVCAAAPGHRSHPMTAAERHAKFTACAAPVLGGDRAARLAGRLDDLAPDLPVSALPEILRGD